MPYIKPEDRDDLLHPIAELATKIQSWGEFNYAVTELLLAMVQRFNPLNPDYGRRVEPLAHLEAIKLEYYRRFVAPYEDRKIKENGDVYPPEA